MSVNALCEVPDAEGYIIELGIEDSNHPAAAIDRDRIRDEFALGEWYIRTGNQAEENNLMRRIDQEVNHERLPAYLILDSHPTEAREGLVIYLNRIDEESAAWLVLQEAIEQMRTLTAEGSSLNLPILADHLTAERVLVAMSIGSDAIDYIEFLR